MLNQTQMSQTQTTIFSIGGVLVHLVHTGHWGIGGLQLRDLWCLGDSLAHIYLHIQIRPAKNLGEICAVVIGCFQT